MIVLKNKLYGINKKEGLIRHMAEIKPGMIASMKVTGDEVFVLSIEPIQNFHHLAGVLSGVLAQVRRPVISEKGCINYTIEHYLVDELETKEEFESRKVQELEALKA